MPRFSKANRLHGKKKIGFLFTKGKSFTTRFLRIVYCINNPPESNIPVVGFSVPKKNFKSAVKRNLLKRRMREAYRQQMEWFIECTKESNPDVAFMMIYQSDIIQSFDVIAEDVTNSLKVLCRKIKNE